MRLPSIVWRADQQNRVVLAGDDMSAVASVAPVPNRIWLAISSTFPRRGLAYLAIVLDLFSRRVIGWAMSETMPQELKNSALRMAITNRRQPICRSRIPMLAEEH
jgi:transposase InsO family protein